MEPFQKYTNIDPNSPELLTVHFILQSAADIRRKLQKATAGPQTTMNQLLDMAFAVFN